MYQLDTRFARIYTFFHGYINSQTIFKFPDRLIGRRACLRLIPVNTRHTLPRLARSTLNELQQNKHEKASLVCVHVKSPSGLALVPCALSIADLSSQLPCWITHAWITHTSLNHTHTWYRIMVCLFFWHPLLVRPVMMRLSCLKAKKGLGRFALQALPHY